MITFGEKIKDLRKEKNLTQKEMAQALSVTVSTLSHWECDYQEPSFKDLVTLANFFECNTDYLLGRSDDFGNITVKEKSSSDITSEEQFLLDDFRSLPRSERAQATEYIHYLVEKRGNKNKKA